MGSADGQDAMSSGGQQQLAAKKRKRERQENGGQKLPKRQRSKSKSGTVVQERDGPATELAGPPNHSQSRAITVVRADEEEDDNAEETTLVSSSAATWKVAEPVGGRIHEDVEPIFSSDEKYDMDLTGRQRASLGWTQVAVSFFFFSFQSSC